MSDSKRRESRAPVAVTLVAKDAWLTNRDDLRDWNELHITERMAGDPPPMPWVAIVNALLDAGHIALTPPRPATILIAHPLTDIDNAVDVLCDLDIWSRSEWENTGTEMLHLPSNVMFVPGDQYVADDMRAWPGDEL